MTDRPTGRSLAIAAWLSEVEGLAAQGAWAEARAALDRDIASVSEHAELSALYGETLLRMGSPRDALQWLLPRLETMAHAANRRAWLRIVNLTGAAAFELGQIDDAERFFELAREHAIVMADHLTGARALNNLALVASTRGDWARAMHYYMLAIPTYERASSARGVAECYHNIAATLIESGDLDEAEEWDRRAMQLARETGNERLRAFALGGRAEVRVRKRDYALALVLAMRAAVAFRALHDQSSEAHTLRLVGQAQQGQEDLTAAVATLTNAIALASESGVRRVLGECRLARARCLLTLRSNASARADLILAREDFAALGSEEKVRTVTRLLDELSIEGGGGAS